MTCECGNPRRASQHACDRCSSLDRFYDLDGEPRVGPSERILSVLRHYDWIETADLYDRIGITDDERNKYQVTLWYLIKTGRIERRQERYRMARYRGICNLVRLVA